MTREEFQTEFDYAKDQLNENNAKAVFKRLFDLMRLCMAENHREWGLEIADYAEPRLKKMMEDATGIPFRELQDIMIRPEYSDWRWDLYWDFILEQTYDRFEKFVAYMERKRQFIKKFYEPRQYTRSGKPALKLVAEALQELAERKYKFLGVSLPSRTGKAIAYDTPVLTKSGWKYHGDLTIRDEVIGLDGEFKKILAIHNPCEMEYKVTFSDGESIVCHGNHEWYVWDRHKGKYGNVETKKIAECVKDKDGHAVYMLPLQSAVCGSHKSLWVEPYTLGAWLGDGRNQNPDICGAESDYAIVQKIIDNGYPLAWDTKHKTTGVRYYGFKGLRQDLQHYDMCHSRRKSPKRIPDEYLVADEEQRLELLAGLLDTDGCLTKKERRYHFTTSDFLLMQDFVALVHTFGWRTCVTTNAPKTSTSGITARKPWYTIAFNPTKYIPCALERKQLHEFSEQRRIGIEKVEKIHNHVMGNCITVEGGLYCVGKTLKPTHNSTICIFFLCWKALRNPNSHSAMGGHAGTLVKGFYKELLNLMTSDEYCYHEIYERWYPDHVMIRDKSAEDYTITLDEPDRFATLTCRGIDATWTGAVDVSRDGTLYVDDLVRDRQHSLSAVRMEETFQEYLNKMVDRKNDGAQELMVGTLWNVLDPLERLRKKYEDDPDYKFLRIPALDENDESNFDYIVNGFSTEFYQDMRDKLDNAEWMAKFQQQPFVREGLVFELETLKYFNGYIYVPDITRVYSVCDPAFGGGDNLSMPICYEHQNGRRVIVEWIYDKRTVEYTIPRVASAIIRHHISELRVERTGGGMLLADKIRDELKARGYIGCRVIGVNAPTKCSKEDKILGVADTIKETFEFLEKDCKFEGEIPPNVEVYQRDSDYNRAMEDMGMFSGEGKNKHDDAPDAMAQLAIMTEDKMNGAIDVIPNPYREV